MMHLVPRVVLLLLAAWLAALFDCGIAPLLELHDCAPSACLLAATLTIALSRSSHAFLLAGWFGLAGDLAGAGPLGASLAGCSLVGYLIARLRGPAKTAGMVRAAAELIAATLAVDALLATLHGLLQATDATWPLILQRAVGTGLYSLAFAIPLLVLICSTRSAFQPLTIDA